MLTRLAALLSLAALAPAQLVSLRHWSGQSVAPVYEGYDVNPDGSFNMWFGYMNRNYEEELDLPIGEANHFDPTARIAASRRTSRFGVTRTRSR